MGCSSSNQIVSRRPIYEVKDIELKKIYQASDPHNLLDENNSSCEGESVRVSRSSSLRSCPKQGNEEFLHLSSGSELTKGPSSESIKISSSSTPSEGMEETTIDDIRLLNCSKFLKIREIVLYSNAYIAGINIKYRLPTGKMIESIHSLNPSGDVTSLAKVYHQWKSLTLGPEEFINQITCGHTILGMTMLALTTTTGRKLIVEGESADENQTITDYNLADENKVLAGLRTKFHQDVVELSCYVTEINHANLDDIIKESTVSTLMAPMVTKTKVKRVKSKRKVIRKKSKARKVKENYTKPKTILKKLSVIKEDLAEASMISTCLTPPPKATNFNGRGTNNPF